MLSTFGGLKILVTKLGLRRNKHCWGERCIRDRFFW